MARFKWRLDIVKRAKERQEDRKKRALEEAQNAQLSEERALSDLVAARDEQRKRLESRQSGRLNPVDLRAAHEYITQLGAKIEAQEQRTAVTRRATDERKAELVKAVQENKALENLRTRDYEAFRKDQRKREQAETDETANRSAHRTRQDSES